jgi:anti-sigma regulatory factor (Ser/Thr protein kinase)
LRVAVLPDLVRVEVSDRGAGFRPPTGPPPPRSASGWGLYLVDQLADRWGIDTDGDTTAWFEIDR